MLYDLVVYKDEISPEYTEVNFSDNDTSLEGIINFTTSFANYDELMKFLYEAQLIPETYLEGSFKIHSRRSTKSEPILLPFGIAYGNERKFFSQAFLVNFFVDNMDDNIFIDSFIQKYYNYLKNNPRVNGELYYLRFCREFFLQYGYDFEETRRNEFRNKTTSMRNFIIKYTEKKNKDGKKVINYVALRDLAMFAINYQRAKLNIDPDISTNSLDTEVQSNLNKIKAEIKHYKSLLKDTNPDDEEYTYYITKIEELENQLQMRLIRRLHNETTEY